MRIYFQQTAADTWAVTAFLPEAHTWAGTYVRGTGVETPPEVAEHWSADEARKLARVLERAPREKLMRWRPEPKL